MPIQLYPKNLSSSEADSIQSPPSTRQIRKNALQAYWDRYWKLGPPPSLVKEQRRNWLFSQLETLDLFGKGLVVGCEDGRWLDRTCFAKLFLDACDVSRLALEKAQNRNTRPNNIRFFHECFPFTKLASDLYDAVFLIDLVADIEPSLRRLGISELARICKKTGYIIVSSALDRKSPDAISHLLALLQTELEVVDIQLRYDQVDVILEKMAKKWPLVQRLMNSFFWQSFGPGYAYIVCRVRPLK